MRGFSGSVSGLKGQCCSQRRTQVVGGHWWWWSWGGVWQWVVGVVVAVELFGRLFALLFKVEFVVLFVDVADTTNTLLFREFFFLTTAQGTSTSMPSKYFSKTTSRARRLKTNNGGDAGAVGTTEVDDSVTYGVNTKGVADADSPIWPPFFSQNRIGKTSNNHLSP